VARRPPACGIGRFARDQSGAVSVEAVLWIPFFFMLLALITDASLAFFSRAEAFRIVQTGNRLYSVGTYTTTAEVQGFVTRAFQGQSRNAVARTVTDAGGRVVGTQLHYPMRDVVLFGTGMPASWRINVQSMHYVEWPRR
jgi:Flp pilus assembly protein TadG